MKNTLLFLFLLVILASCEHCGPQKELSLRIYLRGDTLKLDSISALNALNQTAFREQIELQSPNSRQFDLPMSLLADSTTYIFAFKTRTDTLTVFYKRDFSYKNGCGFIVDAHSPDLPTKAKSTFSKVDVTYDPYVSNELPSFEYIGGNGISILVTL